MLTPPTTPPRPPSRIPPVHFSPPPPTHGLIIPPIYSDGPQIDRKPEVDIKYDLTIEIIIERLKSEPLTTLYESEKEKIDDINEIIQLYIDPYIPIPDTATDTDIKIIDETTIASFKDKGLKLKVMGCALSNTYTVDKETNTGYKLFITKDGQMTDACRNTFINELVLQKYASLINHHHMNKLPVEPDNVIVRVPEITGYGKVVVIKDQTAYQMLIHRGKFVEVEEQEKIEVYYIKMEHFGEPEYSHAEEVYERGEGAFDSVSHVDGNVEAALNQLAEKLGLLHNDERKRNILKGNNEVVFIDFGESTVTRPSGFGGKPRNRRVHKKTIRREGTRRKTKTTRRGGTRRKTKTQRRKRKSNKKK